MGRNPIQRSPEEQEFRTTYIRQHGRSKGATKAWRRKQQRLSGRSMKTNLVKSRKMTTAIAIIPGQTVVDHLPRVKKTAASVKVYNAETGKMDKVEPANVSVFQKMVNAWGVFRGTKTGRR